MSDLECLVRIANSDLLLRSEHAAETRRLESETLRTWTGPTRPDFEGSRAAAAGRPGVALAADALLRISEAARALAATTPPAPNPASHGPIESQTIDASGNEIESDPFLQLIKSMVELLTGQPIKLFSARQFSRDIETRAVEVSRATAATNSNAPNRPAGWGLEYDFHAVSEEAELTQVTAAGSIRTSDGQQIAFKLDLTMQRHYREETNVSIRAGDGVRKDPLVINFGGTAAQLSDQRFSFDLLGNGSNTALPLFASASGYLALDLNSNGKIDSGKELFGPTTNSGFAELAQHDQDGNGWIDENDSAFVKLRVWTPSADGNGALTSLKAAGVGAIALTHVDSPFELRGAASSDLGAVRASSVWLADTGEAGSVQEIDLTV